MAIFDRFFKKQKPNQTKSTNMVGYFGIGTGDSKNYQYDELAREGYLKKCNRLSLCKRNQQRGRCRSVYD